MRFKIDENLPVEVALLLRNEGHDAMTVDEEDLAGSSDSNLARICRNEDRVLITLDLDFSDIRAYPPNKYSGLIVLRLQRQDKLTVMTFAQRLIPLLSTEVLKQRLWILDENKVRVRE